jgi:hypothetical protein
MGLWNVSHWTGVAFDHSAYHGAQQQKLKELEIMQANANPQGMGIDAIIRLLVGIYSGE